MKATDFTDKVYSSPMSVDKAQQDLGCLEILFQQQYVVRDYYASIGISLDDRLVALSNGLQGPITQYDLMKLIFQRVHAGTADGHLEYYLTPSDSSLKPRSDYTLARNYTFRIPIRFEKTGSTYRPMPNQQLPTGIQSNLHIVSCDGLQPHAAIAPDGTNFISFVGAFPFDQATGITHTVKCTDDQGQSLSLVSFWDYIRPDVNTSGKTVTWEDKGDGILYVRIWEFGQQENGQFPAEQMQLLQMLRDQSNEKSLILDFRATQTGDSSFGEALARLLHSAGNPPIQLSSVNKQSLYSAAGQVNIMENILAVPNVFGPMVTPQSANQAMHDSLLAEFNNLVSNQGYTMSTLNLESEATSNSSEPLRTRPYSKPVVILTDNFCGSSCEISALQFRKLKNAVYMGMNTSGNIHFMSPGINMLPNSKIRVMLSPKRFSFSPDVVEGVGMVPDLYVFPTSNAEMVDAAVAYLKQVQQ